MIPWNGSEIVKKKHGIIISICSSGEILRKKTYQ